MKILVIGDIHGNLKAIKKIPKKDIDLIILTGDLGSANILRKLHFENIKRKLKGLSEINNIKTIENRALDEAYLSALKILKYLSKFTKVYTIYGNVEGKIVGAKLDKVIKRMKNVETINNKFRKINTLKILGLRYFTDLSWIKEFKPSNYTENFKDAKNQTIKVRNFLNKNIHCNILVCHQPPYGILDKVNSNFVPKNWKGKHAGSKTILNYIKKQKPNYVFCGHIHEGKGFKKIGQTKIYNLGINGYKIININN